MPTPIIPAFKSLFVPQQSPREVLTFIGLASPPETGYDNISHRPCLAELDFASLSHEFICQAKSSKADTYWFYLP